MLRNANATEQLIKLISGPFTTDAALELGRLGADPDSKNDRGKSLLHLISDHKNNKDGHNNCAIRELVNKHHANIDIKYYKDTKDVDGYTPLQCLLSGAFPPSQAMELIVLGADPEAKSSKNESFLDILKRNNQDGRFNETIKKLNKLTQYYGERKLAKAIDDSTKVTKIDPNVIAFCQLGHEYYKQDEFLKAIEYYNKAIKYNTALKSDNTFVSAYYMRGNVYYRNGNLVEAIANYAKVLTSLTPGSDCYNLIADILEDVFSTQDLKQAKADKYKIFDIIKQLPISKQIALLKPSLIEPIENEQTTSLAELFWEAKDIKPFRKPCKLGKGILKEVRKYIEKIDPSFSILSISSANKNKATLFHPANTQNVQKEDPKIDTAIKLHDRL